MLSSSAIKNAGQASHYFGEKDNYYSREEGLAQSEWWGKGAQKMGLAGIVEDRKFTNLLEGRLATGEQLGKMVDGVIKHRAGWDLTFSAPKSVSIMALVAGDQRLVVAHREAVRITLEKIQQGCAQARIKVNGEMRFDNTKNLMGALYHHDLSRAKDPQLHTHSVIMNMTARTDGKWRSLASKIGRYNEETLAEVNGFIERVRHHNRYYSKLYETELAFRVKACGYELHNDTKSGIFEIAGIPEVLVEQFSKRRQEIEAMLENKGLSGGKAAAIATLSSRNNKEKVDREVLHNAWQAEVEKHGIDLDRIKTASMERQSSPNQQSPQVASNKVALAVVREATQQLAVFQSSFSLEQIMEASSKEAIARHCDVSTLLGAMDDEIREGNLLPLANEQGKSIYMAKSTLDDEKELISRLSEQASTVSQTHLGQFLAQHTEIPENLHAHLATIFGNDRLLLIEGQDNRNNLVAPILQIAGSANMEAAILSPSLIGGKKLAKEMQAQPQTLWEHIKALFVDTTPKHYSVMQFLSMATSESNHHPSPKLLIVDQAHLISTHQKAKLAAWAHDNDAKILLFGNEKQLLPWQVSTSLKQLSDHGLKTIGASTPLKTEHVVTMQNVHDAMARIQDNIVEVTHIDDRQYAMATHYTRLPDDVRKQSWIATSSKANAEKINQQVHEILHKSGKVKKTIMVDTLSPHFIPADKLAKSSSYAIHQMVRFNEDYASLGIARGSYLQITKISRQSNRIILQKENGNRVVWQPDRIAGKSPGKIEVFDVKRREFGAGDSLVLSRTLKVAGLVKGERCHIETIHQNRLTVRTDEGKLARMDITRPEFRHLDYGYVATLHAISHENPAVLLADLPAQSLSTHQRRLNQLLSQSGKVCIYTDDTKKLATTLTKQTGDQLSAHDIHAKADSIKSALNTMYDLLEQEIAKVSQQPPQEQTRIAIDAIDYALKHLTERQAGFTHKDLMKVAMQHGLGKVTEKTLSQVAMAMEKANVLLRGHRDDGTLWTTAEAIKIEREIIALNRQDQGKLTAISSEHAVLSYLENKSLRPEQVDAIKAIVTSTDRVLSIQGRAGTGKTTMMSSLESVLSANDMLKESGYSLRGIAPTNKAVRELTSRGIQAQTIDSFLLELQQLEQRGQTVDYTKTLFVVDEASMVSSQKMLGILQAAHRLNFCRIIPTGDTHQNPSIEAGKPQELLQNTASKVIHLNDIQRQQNPVLKEAALALYEGKTEKSFSLLSPHIMEIRNEDSDEQSRQTGYAKRVEAIVSDYFTTIEKGEDAQIIAPAHSDRKIINQAVREQLEKTGALEGEPVTLPILTSKDMTRAERTKAANFQPGQIVKFVSAQNKSIQANDYYQIKGIDKPHNLLMLTSLSGNNRDVIWQIPSSTKEINRSIEVFTRENRELQVGDKIIWTRTNKRDSLLSADISKVTNIEKGMVTVKNTSQQEFTFDSAQSLHQHWDHAYALTTYSTQGGTYDIVLGFFETCHKNLMNLKTFLVTITRPVNELRIYTDNRQKMENQIISNSGNKISSLEVVGEYPIRQIKRETPSHRHLTPRYNKYQLGQIIEGLNKDAEKIAADLLGKPKVRGSHFMKFGTNQGSLSVTTKGEHQGWWHDFGEGKGGRSMLSFIQHHAGLGKQEAIEYGAKWVGISPLTESKDRAKLIKNEISKSKQPDQAVIDDEKNKIAFARKLAAQSQPMAGTLVERYLKEQRGIEINNHPDDIRFHPGIYSKLNNKTCPAMLVIARDHHDNVKAVQATYIDPDSATKVDKTLIAVQKQTFGVMKGSSVTIKGAEGAPTLIAEGVETGMSLKQALPYATVKITLSKSNFKNIHVASLTEKTILCLDYDGKEIRTDKAIFDAAKRLVDANKQVSFMVPENVNQQKQDYNDVLKTQGVTPIKRDFAQAIPAHDFYGMTINLSNAAVMDKQKINVISRNLSSVTHQNNQKMIAAHRSVTTETPNREPVMTATKQIEIER